MVLTVKRINCSQVVIEKVVEVPQVQTEFVYRDLPVPQIRYREVEVEKKVDQPYDQKFIKYVDVPVPKYWERYTYKPVPRPQFRGVPVPHVIEK